MAAVRVYACHALAHLCSSPLLLSSSAPLTRCPTVPLLHLSQFQFYCSTVSLFLSPPRRHLVVRRYEVQKLSDGGKYDIKLRGAMSKEQQVEWRAVRLLLMVRSLLVLVRC